MLPAFLLCLVAYVWHEGHESCALCCACEVSLPLSGKACAAAAVHASMRIHLSFKPSDVFVVNVH